MFYFDFDEKTSERYAPSKYMEKVEGTVDILTSYFIIELQKLQPSGVFQVSSEIYRPDLISYKIYGHVQFWWIILIYNDLISPWELTVGKELSFPSLDDLENLYFSLKVKELREEE